MAVHVFKHHRHDTLADKVQAWLNEHPTFAVRQLAAASTNSNHCVTLVGEETSAQQGYRIMTVYRWAGTSDSDLASEIDQAIQQGAGQLEQLAQSGNQGGYFVALLLRV